MKNSALSGKGRLRFALAALAGVLISLGFAPANLAGAAWIGPGLSLFCALGQPGRRTFALGFTAGFVFFLCSLYWLLWMPMTWHGLPLAPALGWVALSAYSALYHGAWVWCAWRLFPGGKPQNVEQFLARSVWRRMGWAILCAMVWTALEFMRGRFLGGFPWNFLGTSQAGMLPLIQFASVTGVFGVSFLMVWFSVALGGAMLSLVRRPASGRVMMEMALPLLTIGGLVAFGMSRVTAKIPAERTLKAVMIQPNFRQTLIWDPAEDAKRFDEVLQMSEEALAAKPDLLIWPESAVPNLSPDQQQQVARLLEKYKVWLLFCEDSAELTADGETRYFNSCFLVQPENGIQAIYHKRRLVIFGEYIPLVHWLPFLKWIAPDGPGFTPGDKLVPFDMTNPRAHLSPLICFEDSFPEEAREHAGAHTDLLINLTNDGWFGEGAEQWQQAASAVFRCVENDAPMLRCCNDGVTCRIDSAGRMDVFRDAHGSIYGRGFMTADMPLLGKAGRRPTFYNLHGDVFAWFCGIISSGAILGTVRRRVSTGTVSKI